MALTPQGGSATEMKVKGESSEDEEKKWLDALEAGTLDDTGEIPKTRDPNLLTARQVSLMSCSQSVDGEGDVCLPSGSEQSVSLAGDGEWDVCLPSEGGE